LKKGVPSVGDVLKKDESTAEATIGGMVFDADYLKGHFFPDALQNVISRNLAEGQSEHQAVLMIHPKGESDPLVASEGWDGGPP
jgi:hypothetical protein